MGKLSCCFYHIVNLHIYGNCTGMLLNGASMKGKISQPVSNTGVVTLRCAKSNYFIRWHGMQDIIFFPSLFSFFLMCNYPRNLHMLLWRKIHFIFFSSVWITNWRCHESSPINTHGTKTLLCFSGRNTWRHMEKLLFFFYPDRWLLSFSFNVQMEHHPFPAFL